jgi:hypothetical protein
MPWNTRIGLVERRHGPAGQLLYFGMYYVQYIVPEGVPAPPLVEFAGLSPTAMLCYPISQHLAEKVHACSRPHPGSANTRAKDLLDILLLGRAGTITTDALSRALEAALIQCCATKSAESGTRQNGVGRSGQLALGSARPHALQQQSGQGARIQAQGAAFFIC